MSFRCSFLKLVVYILGFLCLTLNAQQLDFYKYGVEKGLSQETINTILKASNGFLWLGTQDGLNRFDGHSFKVYKAEKNNPKSISGNFINDLVEDKSGRIWIATKNNGLCYYSPDIDEFIKIEIDGLSNNTQCNKLSLDSSGNLYAAFLDQGLAIVTFSSTKINVAKIPFFNSTPANITALNIINNTVWVGTREGKVYYTNATDKTSNFKRLNFSFNSQKIHAFNRSYNGIWIGADNGLFHLNETNKHVNPITLNTNKPIAVFDVFSKNNTVFLATDSGFFRCQGFEISNSKFSLIKTFDTRSSKETGLLTNRINCVFVEDDFLWLGADKLYQATLKKQVFSLVQKNRPKEGTLNNEHVYTFAKSEHGLWVGTLDGLHLRTSDTTYYYNNFLHNTVRSVAIDTKNNLWIGTQKGVAVAKLDSLNPRAPNFIVVEKHTEDSLSLSNPKVRNIHTDSNGNVWIATLGGGTHRFTGDIDQNDFRFQQFRNTPNNDNSISTNVNYVFYKDRSNTYWIGTENGLNKLQFGASEFKNPIFTHFKNEEENIQSISSNTILSIYEDVDDILWIGTLNGLNRYDKKNNSFKTYNESNGLTNNVIYAIQEDASGMLWLTTNAGIFSFSKATGLFRNYNVNDGLQGNEFNLGASFKDENGILYFGGTNGYNYFNPEDISKLDNDGSLTFTNVKINDTNQYFNALINKNVSQEAKIQLAYNQFPFYLEFSDLDFNPQKNNSYVYKLMPNDTDWNNLQSRKEIQFLNMASGDYTLLVQGKTRGKLWTSKPLQLALEVSPPWWRTYTAYIIYTLLLLSFISALYYFQLQKKLQEQKNLKLKELDTLKTKLYTNITHEFRTPLTVIKGVSANLKSDFQSHKNFQAVKSLKTIEHNSDMVLKLVNQMLDLAKIDRQKMSLNPIQADLVWYLKHIANHFSSYAQSKEITLTFYSETKELLTDFDAQAIQKIMSNLLSNAIKNCQKNDQIVVHLKTENSSVLINVKDSGKGINTKDLPYIFDRFYQVDHSIEYTEEGSGIGLTLTKELVQLMNGSINVESEIHVGTTFSITLPITNNAPMETLKEQLLDALIISHHLEKNDIEDNHKPVKENAIVLVVDDNTDILNLLHTSLKSHYNIVTATNGNIGIEKAIEIIPDVIISDIMMPEKNGFELCKTLKNDERTSHIPIILLTAKASEQDKIRGLSNGADAFVTKPFNKAELFVRIQELIKLRVLLYQKYSSASSWDAIPSKNLEDKDAAFMNKVLFCIEQHLDDASFNSMRLSRELDLSESQLYRKLKAITDASTAVFIRRVRLQKAKTILQNSEFTISEVAYQTGFNSPGWFSRAFKEEFGYAPNEIRK
ncbi:hybrid sensor histidine kinase/response regulator transcription factor [uncultured Psychroserpens sp.]|uniref:hybrid sensor histidine kinase/response regulator transcription factor n=1 Tax=uncultured Psychroserpens sp. TaxID=255436 RepID=UPI00261DE7A6|nr:hybrid sensor histidine kinase/response regulator transcription factor [uncultured Psychroserpens sp.]